MTALPVTKHQLADNEFAFELVEQTDTGDYVGIRSGRWRFFAYWLDDYLPPDGVRGQMFDTWIENWITQRLLKGEKVTPLDNAGRAILQLVAADLPACYHQPRNAGP